MIPRGRVASYGQVAQMAGYPEGAARAVGNALHRPTPAHRPTRAFPAKVSHNDLLCEPCGADACGTRALDEGV